MANSDLPDWLDTRRQELMIQEAMNNDDRLMRLFANACCRLLLWESINDYEKKFVENSDLYADKLISENKFIHEWMNQIQMPSLTDPGELRIRFNTSIIFQMMFVEGRCHQIPAAIVDVFCYESAQLTNRKTYEIFLDFIDHYNWNKAWNTDTVVNIASKIYTEQRWQDCPILADALEEAGAHASITDKLRRSRKVYRGDLLIDKARGVR